MPLTVQAPWVWSEQFGLRLQSADIVPAAADDVMCLRRPGKRADSFSFWSFRGDELRAVEAISDPGGYMLGETCLEKGLSSTHDAVTDAAFDMKAFVAAK